MNKFKTILSILFFVLGLSFAYFTYRLVDKDSVGKIESFDGESTYRSRTESPRSIAAAGGGIDSSNDGVAVGFGIISGFSFLSSVLLVNSLKH